MTDSRYADYRNKYGEESWELDALEPKVIQDLISTAVLQLRDQKLWDQMTAQQTEDKMYLEALVEGRKPGDFDDFPLDT